MGSNVFRFWAGNILRVSQMGFGGDSWAFFKHLGVFNSYWGRSEALVTTGVVGGRGMYKCTRKKCCVC